MSIGRLAAALVVAGSLFGQSLSHRLDEVFADWTTAGSPGGAFVLVQDGKVRYTSYTGLANVESKEPIDFNTQFQLASVSKQFTAMAVMILAEAGKLSYDDPVSRFIPEFPVWAKTITIRNLLNHTSGLPDYFPLLVRLSGNGLFHPYGTPLEHEFTATEALAALAKQPALRFGGGSKYQYSNSGYVVLAQIVERASEMRFAEFLHDRVFNP